MDNEEILLQKYPNLKKQNRVGENFKNKTLQLWSHENLSDGLKKYFDDNGRYPTAEEIDAYEYLPSSRQIQRAFGGLKSLRTKLGLPISDFGSGENRSKIAKEIGKRGIKGEKEIENVLINFFGEHFVHVEKPLNRYFPKGAEFKDKLRGDFFVYHKDGEFVVDVFFAKNRNQINGNLNAKREKYQGITIKTYFIVMHEIEEYSRDLITQIITNRSNKLDQNIIVLNKSDFLKEMQQYNRLHHTTLKPYIVV